MGLWKEGKPDGIESARWYCTTSLIFLELNGVFGINDNKLGNVNTSRKSMLLCDTYLQFWSSCFFVRDDPLGIEWFSEQKYLLKLD